MAVGQSRSGRLSVIGAGWVHIGHRRQLRASARRLREGMAGVLG